MADLSALQNRIGYTFQNAELLRLALTHPSIAHEAGSHIQTNQRLEFLGDAVLQLILTRALYDTFPGYGEGPLTKARATLVNRRTLAQHARSVGLHEHIFVSRGEEQTGGRTRPSAMADVFEAVVGALFLDGGLEAARTFVMTEFAPHISNITELPSIDNPKGELQEMLQATSAEAPKYELISASGPDHDRSFECKVTHSGIELGRGTGKSKKDAETAAALVAYQALKQSKQA
ncbi:MAG: Ribonuclease 3 [Verrucomicrobiota bacterium]